MSMTVTTPVNPRVRLAHSAPDGECFSTEFTFNSPLAVEMAATFNRLTAAEQAAFGSPSDDDVRNGSALFVRFLAFCHENGVTATNDGMCAHSRRRPHADVVRTFTYSESNPIKSIDLNVG